MKSRHSNLANVAHNIFFSHQKYLGHLEWGNKSGIQCDGPVSFVFCLFWSFIREGFVQLGLCRHHINVIHVVFIISNGLEHISPQNTSSPIYLLLHSKKKRKREEERGEEKKRKRGDQNLKEKSRRRRKSDKNRYIMGETPTQTRRKKRKEGK